MYVIYTVLTHEINKEKKRKSYYHQIYLLDLYPWSAR
jgi:hypothetical protein